MRTIYQIAIVLILALVCLAGCATKAVKPETAEGESTVREGVVVKQIGIKSSARDAFIPTYVTVAENFDSEAKHPFVIMLHGHGGNHNEWGGYDAISDGLAKQGFIVVTLDYSGCGASTESFKLNTMTNMKSDTLDVISYYKNFWPVDKKNIGIFGYSMGGRLALEITADGNGKDFATMVLVAPAEDLEDLKGLFGGADKFAELQAQAEKDGYVDFTTIYSTLPLSKEWFEDLEKHSDNLVEDATAKYSKESLVIWATDDTTVHPEVSQHVADVLGSTTANTIADGHSYSFYSTNADNARTVNGGTIDWFVSHLK